MIKRDLLRLYIGNHHTQLHYYAMVFVLLVLTRLYLYGTPRIIEIIAGLGLIFLCQMFFVRQQKLYGSVLKHKGDITSSEFDQILTSIAINKAGYMLPFLVLMFWPLHSTFFFEHILGYVVVFCTIAFYTSASAVYFPLMIWDVGMLLAFTVFIVALNFSTQETPYAGAIILAFGAYTFGIGRKINRSAIALVNSKEELKKTALAAIKAQQAKSTFLAVMSHEIRTPLSGIMGMIDFLKETALTAEQKKYLDTISNCSGSLINTLNDVLDISKIEAGKFSIVMANFDLHETLKGIVDMARPLVMLRGNTLHLELPASVPQIISSDADRLRQILNNLINNAIKFTLDGNVQIRASYDLQAKFIKVQVKDSGIGITRENQEKLFKKFSQIDSGVSRQYGGTGLGLSIASQLVTLMGGHIGVESNEGLGSCFWFEIPYVEPIAAPAAEESIKTPVPSAARLCILLVDDNKLNQQIVERFLVNRGHTVRIAQSGQDALREVQARLFDIILMDLHMPGMSGIEATLAIKKLGTASSRTPIIALTANVLKEDLDKCREAGMVDHIAKPIDKEQFFKIIAKHSPVIDTGDHDTVESSAPPLLNHKIKSIYEEFGPGYAAYFVNDNIAEIKKLISLIKRSLEQRDFLAIAEAAHTLISVTGNMGMDKSSELARSLETQARRPAESEIIIKIQQLDQASSDESIALQQSLE